MAGLGDTTAALRRMRKAAAATGGAPSQAGLLAETSFSPNPGNLRMLSYAPPGVDKPPLVVVLHGCTQGAEAFAQGAGWIDLASRCGFALLCPEQRAANNANRCFNWFEPAHTRRGDGEAASIRAMIDRAVKLHDVDPQRIFVTGLSAGGAMAAVMLAAYPETFAGGAIIAGLPYGAASSMHEAFASMMQPQPRSGPEWGRSLHGAGGQARDGWPDISIWHGGADSTVHVDNAEAIARQWRHAHGLDRAAAEVDNVSGYRRERWRDSGGFARVTRYSAPGLGHGAPVKTSGTDACGEAGPFLIAGPLSSSLQIARDWGLAEAAAANAADLIDPAPAEPTSLAGEIDAVIRNALAAAGLIR
jgi:poly(hydroxyalkanoate) depolymerase family esterase